MKSGVADTPRFVVDALPDGIVTLSPDQSHHLSRVLRLKTGDAVVLIDGKGTFAFGEISQVHGKHTQVHIRKRELAPNLSRVSIAFALPKPQALDFVVRRCAELGALGLQPLISEHSSPAKNWNADRWRRIVEEVSKQCQRPHFPKVGAPIPLEKFLEGDKRIFVCDEAHREGESPPLDESAPVWALVGPEGGWSAGERDLFENAGVGYLGLGPFRLRAETACLVALTRLMERTGQIV